MSDAERTEPGIRETTPAAGVEPEFRDPHALGALAAMTAAAVLLIPLEWFLAGGIALAVGAGLTATHPAPALRRRMGMMLFLVALLAVAPIDTRTDDRHFVSLGAFFLAALLVPYLVLRRTDPGVITYRLLPDRLDRLELFYVALSAPLAWGVIYLYFFVVNPELPTHWVLPAVESGEETARFLIGINCVGIWDELFFINTSYAILRSLFPVRLANAAQAALYAAVLYDMAFTGIGPFVVYGFALTQGVMYERSRVLLYVLAVHVIVDVFLVAAVLGYYYPGHWHLG
ncbi:hypothetical protein K8I85_10215, partial [bacterium]|nr:hypothetical protein [bacterium]